MKRLSSAPRRRTSERQRWVTVATYTAPGDPSSAARTHAEVCAVVRAFAAVGRVVRVEPGKYNDNILTLKARRA